LIDTREFRLAVFEKNVEATIPKLRRYARALTRDAEIADDLVQDTLLRALRSKHLFHGDVVNGWLYTILINLNRNRLRSLARRPAISPLEGNDAPDAAVPEASARDIERARSALTISVMRCCWSFWRASHIVRSRRCRACRLAP
jgi:RNA polymerase sigma-70 factor (ECF subfamily)